MARYKRVEFELDSGKVQNLPAEEIRKILRAADELISTGGRNLLVKILKGSKDKKVLEYELDKCPAYGFYKELSLEEIGHRVDWMIEEDYLQIEYSGRLPVLVYSEKGWEIERETYAEELFQRMREDALQKTITVIPEMEHKNRKVITDVLEKVRSRGDRTFIPQLDAWKENAVRKVKAHIESVEKDLTEKNRLAVLFPGLGYTCDKPLLYYTGKLCAELGYKVVTVPYGNFQKGVKGDAEKMHLTFYSALRQAEEILKEINWTAYDSVLFVGKSIGTEVASCYAKDQNLTVRSIYYTPLEETFLYTKGEGIAFHGTSDPWAETAKIQEECEKQNIPLFLTEHANHSLETGIVETDLRTIQKTMDTVEQFIKKSDLNN